MFLIDTKTSMNRIKRNGDNVVSLFQQSVKSHPDKPCFIMIEGRQWTFREVDEYTNAVGNYFYEQGYRKVESCMSFIYAI